MHRHDESHARRALVQARARRHGRVDRLVSRARAGRPHAALRRRGTALMNRASPETGRWLMVFALGYLALLVDGADVMMYGLTLTRIKSEFGLTNVEAGALGSLTLVGMAVGGILGGWASDRLGRGRGGGWGLALFSLGAGLLGLTHSFLEFAVVRFISSMGIGCMVLVTTLVAEYVPTER